MGRTRNIFLATVLVFSGPGSAYANPLGAQVVGGSATVSGQGTASVTVNQSSQNAIINWNTFNIGAGERTQFIQPSSSSIALNRVTGGLGPSSILGTLTANGRVFVVNPDGVLFGAGAVIDTAGFLATTSDIKNENFMSGNYRFDIAGRPNASIVNLGAITAQNSGFAALVAPGVRNAGTISAQMGTVGLASGNGFTLDFYGDKLITLSVSDSVAGQVKDVATGQTLASLVTNTGKLSANGGRVELSAVSARQIVDSVINTSGVIEANTVGARAGKIVLGGPTISTKVAGAPKQTVKVSGTLSASGKNAGEKGGVIQITGEDIRVASANVDASGYAGGGRILIGGDVGGGAGNAAVAGMPQAALEAPSLAWPIANASFVAVDAATVLDASAKASGDGGKVVVWADQTTQFAGQILAKAGTAFGNGGFAEVSGHDSLRFTGTVDLGAPKGVNGKLLLDPSDVTIGNGANDTLSPSALAAALETSDVIVTTNPNSAGTGTITISADISWATSRNLTLAAYRDVVIADGVTISNVAGPGSEFWPAGSLNIGAGLTYGGNGVWTPNGLGTVRFEGTGTIDFSRSFGAVNFAYNPTGGYANPTDFSDKVKTNENWYFQYGETSNPAGIRPQFIAFMWVNSATDLQNVSQNLSGNYIFSSIDASTVSNFTPIGTASDPFVGRFMGLNASLFGGNVGTISNLTIASAASNIGLFGAIGQNGQVSNVALSGATINITGVPTTYSPTQFAGVLAGINDGQILNSSARGTINGFTSAPYSVTGAYGGLVGLNNTNGQISLSSAAVGVNMLGPMNGYIDAGGLVGQNRGSISQSSASGLVAADYSTSSRTYLGGLVGWNVDGDIFNSFATGAVSGAGSHGTAGGLVGVSSGFVYAAYATGPVALTGTDNVVGGLVGSNSGSVFNSYWDVSTSGITSGVNGIGLTTAQLTAALPDGFYPWVWSQNASINGGYPYLPQATPAPTVPTTPITPPDTFPNSNPTIPTTLPPLQQVTLLSNPTDQGNFTQPPPVVTPLPPGPGGPPSQGGATSGPGGGQGGSQGGGQGGGNQGGRGVAGPPGGNAGPPPGPGIGRTLAEQTISGVPPLTETRFVLNEVVLQVSSSVSRERIEEAARTLGMTIVSSQTLDAAGRIVFKFQGGGNADVRAVIRALESNQIVASAQPNYVFGLSQSPQRQSAPQRRTPAKNAAPATIPAAPSPATEEPAPYTEPAAAEPAAADSVTTQSLGAYDTKQYDPAQYIIEKLRLGAVHRRAIGDKVTVALIDSQIDVNHPDLVGVVTDSYDATGSPAKPHAHGTGMAGAIAAHKSILGIAPGVKLLAVRAFSETQTSAESTSFQILKGIDWAIAKGARLINMSFAGPYDPMMERALKNAKDKGIVLIAAAGNAGPTSPPLYPGADPSVIAVTATDNYDQGFKGANRGKYVAVSAPGVDILAASADGQYQFTTGTSVAAAHVSGLAALLLSRRPTLDPESVRQIILSSARSLGPKKSEQFGAGLIDPERALNALELRMPDRVSGN